MSEFFYFTAISHCCHAASGTELDTLSSMSCVFEKVCNKISSGISCLRDLNIFQFYLQLPRQSRIGI